METHKILTYVGNPDVNLEHSQTQTSDKYGNLERISLGLETFLISKESFT